MLTRSEIAAVLTEMAPLLRNGWIQKVQQPTRHSLVLDVRVPGHTHRLLISCEPDASRLHLTSRSRPNPPTPPPFCQFLRAHVQGARIEEICQVANDRIVEVRLTGKEGIWTILCELTGHHANILILDAVGRILRDLTRQQDRTGQLYTPPPLRETSPERISSRFSGGTGRLFPVSELMDAYYQEQETKQTFDRAKEDRLRVLKKTMKKLGRLIEAWQNDLLKATAYREYARYGELIKAHLHIITPGTDHITVTDYFDEQLPRVTIPLDPIKSGQSNMDEYFKKHRKYLAAERELKPRIERTERAVETLGQELKAIQQGRWTAPTTPLGSRHARTVTQVHPTKDRPMDDRRRGPFRRFTSTDGLPIFVGRNARENDELTFGLAKSDDLWLHARGTSGSHVIVRLQKGSDPPTETLRDAATLALLYSDLKKSGRGEVIYTRRKWVKKAKGQAPGAVLITQEKSLQISLDRVRLESLKHRTHQG